MCILRLFWSAIIVDLVSTFSFCFSRDQFQRPQNLSLLLFPQEGHQVSFIRERQNHKSVLMQCGVRGGAPTAGGAILENIP